MSAVGVATSDFVRQQVRSRVTIVMLIVIPIFFVLLSANVLKELSNSLGGDVAGRSATSIGAAWAAGFLGGILGYFQVSSSRDADRRLALAGMGALRVAAARIGACIGLSVLVALIAFFMVWIDAGLDQPGRALVAILTCGLIYVGIGALVGSLVHDELTGSLIVALIFVMDMYAGPGMSDSSGGATLTPTRRSSEVLMAAATGTSPPDAHEWWAVAATVAVSLGVAFGAFWLSSRPRS